MFANYRNDSGVRLAPFFGPGKSRIKWLEITLFGTISGGRFSAPRRVIRNKLWMTCSQTVGIGWTQNLVSGPIPASVKKSGIDRRFSPHKTF
jgi:hypothetical protein